jgi:hypothetical protein
MIYNMLVNYFSCFFTKLVSTLFIGNKFNKSFDIVYILSAIIFVFFLKYALQYVISRFFPLLPHGSNGKNKNYRQFYLN